MPTGGLFIEHLLRIIPELKQAYDEHLVDNDVLLPHVFMGDVTRFIIAEANSANGLSVKNRVRS